MHLWVKVVVKYRQKWQSFETVLTYFENGRREYGEYLIIWKVEEAKKKNKKLKATEVTSTEIMANINATEEETAIRVKYL